MLIDRDKAIEAIEAIESGAMEWDDAVDLLRASRDALRALPPAGVPDEVSELKERIVELERDLELAYHAMQYPND